MTDPVVLALAIELMATARKAAILMSAKARGLH